MCALFLLEAAKKMDKAYSVPPKPTAHTIREATKDIENIRLNLITKEVTTENSTRTGHSFADPTDLVWAKLSNTKWLQNLLLREPTELDVEAEERQVELNLDLDYEIFKNT